MTSIKNSTWQKIATALVAISPRSTNCRGETRALTTTPRGPQREKCSTACRDTGAELVSAHHERIAIWEKGGILNVKIVYGLATNLSFMIRLDAEAQSGVQAP